MTDLAPPPALKQRFLDGMSYAATTVNIVTTDGPAGRHGVTVSAMTSVSADSPRPTLLVCVHELSKAGAAIQRNGVFCVNVLRDDQSAISDAFAGRHKSQIADKFSVAEWTTESTGSPRIVDPLVAFDCELKESLRQGTHHIFIGEVASIWRSTNGSPLVYANRAYGAISQLAPKVLAKTAPADELRLGCLITLAPYVVPALLAAFLQRAPGAMPQLTEAAQDELIGALLGGDCDIALTYDIDLPPGLTKQRLAQNAPYALLPAGHPLAREDAVSLAALASEPLILLDLPMSRDYFLSLFSGHGLTPNIGLRSSSFETVRGLVGHGLGYALLGTKPATAVTYDGHAVTARPIVEPTLASSIVMVEVPGTASHAATAIFKDVCSTFFEGAP